MLVQPLCNTNICDAFKVFQFDTGYRVNVLQWPQPPFSENVFTRWPPQVSCEKNPQRCTPCKTGSVDKSYCPDVFEKMKRTCWTFPLSFDQL